MRAVVIGAGVSGAHACLTLLERGHEVELWDVGREETQFPTADATFHELKTRLPDPVSYFLGDDLGALIPPGNPELLRHPPARRFLVENEDPLSSLTAEGFSPYVSFSKGGLANGWGANALAFDETDLAGWPVPYADMQSAYQRVCSRLAIAGPAEDDLSPHVGELHVSQPPVQLTAADERLLGAYQKRKARLAKLGIKIGRARLAVVTEARRPDACTYCDRCLWGCPRGSIYNPAASTLEACKRFGGFRYVPGRLVLSLASRDGRVTGIRYLQSATQTIAEEACDAVFLAAGALQSGAIFLRTVRGSHPDIPAETEGLMDTAVIKLPYVAVHAIGRPADARAFQFNRLIIGVTADAADGRPYLHGEVLHLTSLLYHSLIEKLPFGSRLSRKVFFALKSALGVVTVFLPDRITSGNRQVLEEGPEGREKVRLCYRETEDKAALVESAAARMRSALRRLGCLPWGLVRFPSGAGIHYAGTIPMGQGPRRCDGSGRSNLFSNLYIADGAAFPALPSKSITLSLAAHATRVALSARI